MNDRSMFILWEISTLFVDDFLVLPSERILGNIWGALTPAVERHSVFWAFTH